MEILKNVNVGEKTTFRLPSVASNYVRVESVDELKGICGKKVFMNYPVWILGGGSNTVFCGDYDGLVLEVGLKGIEVVSESETQVEVKVAAGENWHDFVMWCVENDFGGVENLSLIPGNVGTSPIQNIGAYGVEVKDVISRLTFFDFDTCELKDMRNEDCKFGYRDSIFKRDLKDKGVITSVTFRLSKSGFHKLNLSYGSISKEIEELGLEELSLSDVASVVVKIRKGKLPDWTKIGTAGSFFKNPIVKEELLKDVLNKYPDMPIYSVGGGYVKLAAGWLIDRAGLKGADFGSIGVYDKQALVLVNKAGLDGKFEDLQKAIAEIQKKVLDEFGVELEPEVNVVA